MYIPLSALEEDFGLDFSFGATLSIAQSTFQSWALEHGLDFSFGATLSIAQSTFQSWALEQTKIHQSLNKFILVNLTSMCLEESLGPQKGKHSSKS